MTRILQDLQAPLDRPAAAERVGNIGQTVLVERAGDQQSDDDGNCRGHQWRNHVPQPGGSATDGGTDQRPDQREPRHAGGDIRLSAQPDGDACEELGGGEQARQPNHSPKVGTSVIPAHAIATSGTAAIAPEPSPRRISRSSNGCLPSRSSKRRWPGSDEQ